MRRAAGKLNLNKLNLGAGRWPIVDGYLHLDAGYGDDYLRNFSSDTAGVIECDLVTEFKTMSNIDTIYASHVLEHLTLDEGADLLKKCFDSLQPGGKIRILVPNFDLWYGKLKADDTEFFNYYRSKVEFPLSERYDNNHAFFTTVIYHHGHRMVYTKEHMMQLLFEVGFTNIQEMQWGESSIDNIEYLEPADNVVRKLESLVVEAMKVI